MKCGNCPRISLQSVRAQSLLPVEPQVWFREMEGWLTPPVVGVSGKMPGLPDVTGGLAI